VEEFKKLFTIHNDFTPEVRGKYEWIEWERGEGREQGSLGGSTRRRVWCGISPFPSLTWSSFIQFHNVFWPPVLLPRTVAAFSLQEEAIFRREYLLPRRNRATSEGGRERGASGNSNSS